MLQERPFENIENALEYVAVLREAEREAREDIEHEIVIAEEKAECRKREALLLVKHKLASLDSHMQRSQQLLGDLRKLRRLIFEGRENIAHAASV
jgi:hypothetical protein